MLAAKYSLKGQKNFKQVKKLGKLYQAPLFGVTVVRKSKNETSRFGFVISKKVDKKAVNRNRVRRAMSEAVRRNVKYVEYGYDMIFLAKKTMMRESTESIMKEVQKWIRETKL